MDKNRNNNIVQFDQFRQKEPKDNTPTICLGTLFLDLLLSYDGTSIYVRPSYELKDGLPDDLLDSFNEMLEKIFPEALQMLFELYKSHR